MKNYKIRNIITQDNSFDGMVGKDIFSTHSEKDNYLKIWEVNNEESSLITIYEPKVFFGDIIRIKGYAARDNATFVFVEIYLE